MVGVAFICCTFVAKIKCQKYELLGHCAESVKHDISDKINNTMLHFQGWPLAILMASRIS